MSMIQKLDCIVWEAAITIRKLEDLWMRIVSSLQQYWEDIMWIDKIYISIVLTIQ